MNVVDPVKRDNEVVIQRRDVTDTLHEECTHEQWKHAEKLKNHWYVACKSSELNNHKARSSKVLGLGLVVFRDKHGQATALIDQCVHRGTALSAGELKDGCITCPYHGWTYNREGRVVHIPSQDGSSPPEKPHRFSQRAFPVKEEYGLIWVFMGELGGSKGEFENNEPFEMPFYHDSGWIKYYMVSQFRGSVGALAQNFMDVPHTVFVHNKIFRKSPNKMISSTVEFKPGSVEVVYDDGEDSIGMMPWLTNPEKKPLVHTDKFFAPNVTRCDYHWGDKSGFVITSTITPVDQYESKVYTLISYKLPIPQLIARLLKPFIHLYTRIVLEQDIRIMKVNRQGIRNAPDMRQHSVRADMVHIGIDRLIESYRTGTLLGAEKLGKKNMDFKL